MMLRSTINAVLALSALLGITRALRVPIRRDPAPHSTSMNVSSNADPLNFQIINTDGDGSIYYTATVYVEGFPFDVDLDTGSADLWIDTSGISFTRAVDTGIISGPSYLDTTSAIGNVLIDEVRLGDFVISQQAFVNAPGSNATFNGTRKGLLGVGPQFQSVIKHALENSTYNGSPLLDNIFAFYPNEPNFITFELSRSNLGTTDGGVFTIGEVTSEYIAINNQSRLEVFSGFYEWITVMDGVYVNGQEYTGNAVVDQVSPGSPIAGILLTVLDTGSALALAPPYYVDAIYKNVPGAKYLNLGDSVGLAGTYELPCDTKLNVSMVFNNVEYYVHPLDLITVGTSQDNTSIVCTNTISYGDPISQGQDFLLGDVFLRNVYALYDFGSYTTVGDDASFVQLLSVTDKEKAWAEFDSLNDARIQQWQNHINNTTSSAAPTSPGSSSAPTSAWTSSSTNPSSLTVQGALADDVSNSDNVKFDTSALMRNTYIIIGLLGGVIALLLVLAIFMMVGKGKSSGKGYAPVNNPIYSTDKAHPYETAYDS